MQVIVFASQKGGSGKTTLAGHMAVMADTLGLGPVAMLDTDPQGSLAQWWNARRADTPLFVRSSLTELPETLAELDRRGIRLVCIDTPPAITIAIRSVVENADLVVVPVRPSPHDLRAAGATVDLVEGLDRPFVFIVNAASARARITSDAAVALSQHGTVAPVTVHNRTEYAASMSDGRTVMEINPEGRSTEEMTRLWSYLKDRLDRTTRQGEGMPRHGHGAFADFVRETYDTRSTMVPLGGPGTDLFSSPRPDEMMAVPMRVVENDRVDGQAEDGFDDDIDFDDDDPTGRDDASFAKPLSSGMTTGERLLRAVPTSEGRAMERDFGQPESPLARMSPSVAPSSVPQGQRGGRPVPAQGRGVFGHRHAFGRRGSVEA